MAKEKAMSARARCALPFVTTGVALATAGVLVAVPAIAPPLTARDVQVTADVQTALTAAQEDLLDSAGSFAANSTALLEGLQLIASVSGTELPAGVAQLLQPGDVALQQLPSVGDFLTGVVDAFTGADGGPGGPVAAVGFVIITLADAILGDPNLVSAVTQAFVDGGPVPAVGVVINAVIDLIFGTTPPPEEPEVTTLTADVALQQLPSVGDFLTGVVDAFTGADGGPGGPVAAVGFVVITVADEVFGTDNLVSAVTQAFVDGGPVPAVGVVINAVIDAIFGTTLPPEEPEVTTLTASESGLFAANATTNAAETIVGLATPLQTEAVEPPATVTEVTDAVEANVTELTDAVEANVTELTDAVEAVVAEAPAVEVTEETQTEVTEKTQTEVTEKRQTEVTEKTQTEEADETTDGTDGNKFEPSRRGGNRSGAGGGGPVQRFADTVTRALNKNSTGGGATSAGTADGGDSAGGDNSGADSGGDGGSDSGGDSGS